jgi:hypothetical protein
MSDEQRVEEAARLLEEAMSYVRTLGASGSAPIVHDRAALDMASDDLLNRCDDWLGWASASGTTTNGRIDDAAIERGIRAYDRHNVHAMTDRQVVTLILKAARGTP